MSILDKFNKIEIKNDNRISEDDKIFCEEQQKLLDDFMVFAENYKTYLEINSFSNEIFGRSVLISDMTKQQDYKKDWFISKIVNYFIDKYKITLTYKELQDKYKTDVKYSNILDEIFVQLDGFNFKDKAKNEIITAMKELCHNKYSGKQYTKLNKSKIIIDNFFYVDEWNKKWGSVKVHYNSDDKFLTLFKALSQFNYGSAEYCFSNTYDIITQKENEEVFTTHTLANNGVLSLKLFKNGKIELVFSTSEYAEKFAKEYCGYTENIEQAS
jgi:hypothetical protein